MRISVEKQVNVTIEMLMFVAVCLNANLYIGKSF